MTELWECFDNAGEKIKKYAIGIFIVEAIMAIIGGIGVVISICNASALLVLVGLLAGIIVAAIGILVAYISALFLVAFGDLVQHTVDNHQTNKEILALLQKSNVPVVAAQSATAAQDTAVNTNTVQQAPRIIDPDAYSVGATPVAPVYKTTGVGTNQWVCAHCGTANSQNYSMCKKCGKYRG